MVSFSQMPTLGEFIERAKAYGYRKQTISVPGLGRIKYLRRADRKRQQGLELVDLPPMPESRRLTRAGVASLCARSRVPMEDFGL